MKNIILAVIILLPFCLITAQKEEQTFISLRNTGVEKFQKEHPKYDGRGTIILVLDTGVDMGVDGLTTTSTGEIKVIDVQDFTGQGDVTFYKADIDEENDTTFYVNEEKGFKIAGADKLTLKAKDDEYFIGEINETLWKNSSSGVDDINGDGKTNDKFYFVTFNTEENGENFWVVYIDLNGNGTLADEKPLRNYKEHFDSFTFEKKEGLPGFTLGLNIFPQKQILSLFFDDGSHGTHCAGIASGNKIGGNNFFGIAPGAKVMGLKLGNNNYSGGATVTESMEKAYLYADKVSKERKEPCIINMSFGIGEEIEGHADIERFLEKLVEDNPYLYISTSNGNEGPGISTTGMPASTYAVFSSGAVLAKEVGNDLYGTTLDRDIILHFSSRGGEVRKPDAVSPGACVSTVPNFSRGDRFWGTSMASPYTAGVMSVLLGAMKVEFPNVKIPSELLYKVLRESATPMEGYDYVDQGGGLINIEAAYALMKKYLKRGEIKNFETYSTWAFAPNMPDNISSNLYIRNASFLSGNEKFTFRIKRNNTINSDKFYRIFNLKSTADWLRPIQKKIHIRNNQQVIVNAKIDPKILSTPGLYNTKILASRDDEYSTPEFDLMATFVVPYKFNFQNKYSLQFENEKVIPGALKRYFLEIPYGTSNLNIFLNAKNKKYCSIRFYVHNPNGSEKYFNYFNSAENSESSISIDDLTPGIYELDILGQFTSSQESTYDLSLDVDGINILSNSFDNNNSISVMNSFNKENSYKISANILGFKKEYRVKLNGEKSFSIPFSLNPDESKKEFNISLSKEDFNKVTDFSLLINDNNNKTVESDGMTYRTSKIAINRSLKDKSENYTFIMIPGFADEPKEMEIDITEETYLEESTQISLRNNDLTLFPFIKNQLRANYSLPKVSKPEGTKYFAEFVFKNANTNKISFKKIITINSED